MNISRILVTIIFGYLVGCSQENPVQAQNNQNDDGILSKIEEIMGGKGIPSEAFLVLKNDEVRYMADMEIIFFNDGVKDAFQKLRQERSQAESKMSIEAINNNPAMAIAMQELNASRTAIAEKERSIDGKVEEMRLNLIANLKDSFNDLSQQLESGGKVLEEFKEITTPYDTKIQETQKSLVDLKEDETVAELEQKAFKMINEHIVNKGLKVPKISRSTGILKTEKASYSSLRGRFVISKTKISVSSLYHYTFFNNIPRECQGIEPEIVALWDQKKSVESQAFSLASRISSLQSQRRESLIPWENRHDVDQDEFEEQYGRITRDFENTKRRLDALQTEGPERDQILEEMIAQIKDEILEQRENLDEIEEEILEEAIESMSETLRSTYYNKFISMLGNESELSIRTGSKGDFIIPAGMDYLFATRSRDNGENIFWFLKIEPKFGNFRLSNSNAYFLGKYDDTKTWMYDFYLD